MRPNEFHIMKIPRQKYHVCTPGSCVLLLFGLLVSVVRRFSSRPEKLECPVRHVLINSHILMNYRTGDRR